MLDVPDAWDSGRVQAAGGFQLAAKVVVAALALGAAYWIVGRPWYEAMQGGARAEIQALRDADATARQNAAAALGNVPVDEAGMALAALAGTLDDPEPHVRELAVQSIGRITDTIAADPLARVEHLSPDLPSDGLQAARAGALQAFDDPDLAVRLAAVRTLAILGRRTGSAPPPRLVAALDDPSPDVQAAAVAAVPSFSGGSDLAIPAYFRLVERDDGLLGAAGAGPGLRPSRAAVPDLVARLKGPDSRSRVAAAAILGGMGADASEAIPELLAAFASSPATDDATDAFSTKGNLTNASSQALTRLAPGTSSSGEVVAALAAALRSDRAHMRAAAATALESMGSDAEAAVPALITAIREAAAKEDFSYDGTAAVQALGRIAPGRAEAPAAVAALTEALRSDAQGLRIAAAQALEPFGPQAAPAIPDLQRLQADADPYIQEAATRTLSAVEAPPRLPTAAP
ncbi:HEAT repeat domain-containing protein [Paludisphaera soli]|uniref:HEAT repeat domain-containing protein n=1 Tax=Paludisphaera soli TaxID=2712865 RepID=UPI0013EC5BE2|nr:HEAT repeat domain-containing protein [Paludisphaera soli]